MKKPLLIVIGGPTGSGKTDLSIKTAQHFGCSIISADSRQVFKELPIGSAAPGKEQLTLVKHYFVGSYSVLEPFNAGIFEKEALHILDRLFQENRVQIVCGGSGMYIEALLNGMDNLPEADPETRKSLAKKLELSGIKALQDELKDSDPEYHKTVDLKNPQRLLRALEVIRTTGKSYSELRLSKKADRSFDVKYIAIDLPREELYNRINQRTLSMLSKGWIDETKSLINYRHLNALQTVGYKELFEYIDGKITYERAVELIKQNTRRYAKRQLTWLRGRQGVEWIDGRLNMIELIQRLLVN